MYKYVSDGKVKTTINQRKKYKTQFSKKELDYLEKIVKNIDLNKIKISSHLQNKNMTFDKKTIYDTIKDDNVKNYIFEYNETMLYNGKMDKRVVITSNKIHYVKVNYRYYKKCILNFVISLTDNLIITAWYNEINDRHKTLNMNRYDENLKII